jgi:uncharacterized protein
MQVCSSRSALRWLLPALLLSLTFGFSATRGVAERVEDLPKPTNWVADFAHVLSPETAERIDSLCGQISHSKANAQIEVVTIRTLDGDDIDDFTNRLEEKWKIGKKGSDRGVVLLFAIQDRKRRIEVGYGLEGILPDAKVGDIGRSMIPALRAGDYNQAITGGVVQIANVIATDAGISVSDANPDQLQRQPIRREQRHGSAFGLIFRIIIIVLVLVFLGARGLFGFGLGMLFGGGGRWGGGGGGGDWGGGGGGGGGGFDGSGGGESGGGGASGGW